MRQEICSNNAYKDMAFYLPPSRLADYVNAEKRRHPAIYREAPSSAQLGPERIDEIYLRALHAVSAQSRYVQLEQTFILLRDQLATIRTLEVGWDSHHAPAPNDAAIQAAERALSVLRAANAEPSAVLPSVDGGVGICFVNASRYAHIDFGNRGDVWVLMYGPIGSPETWQLSSSSSEAIREGWTRISGYLQS